MVFRSTQLELLKGAMNGRTVKTENNDFWRLTIVLHIKFEFCLLMSEWCTGVSSYS